MSVPSIWVLSIFWTGYGILGILGIQNIPERYRYKSWTPDYMRANGIGMVIFGISWFILGIVLKVHPLPLLPGFGLAVLFSLPAFVYALSPTEKPGKNAARRTKNGAKKRRQSKSKPRRGFSPPGFGYAAAA